MNYFSNNFDIGSNDIGLKELGVYGDLLGFSNTLFKLFSIDTLNTLI